MSGRFFAMPFLIATLTLVPEIDASVVPWTAAALVLYNVLVPIVPIKTTSNYDGAWPWRTQNGIKDERGHTHQVSNLLSFAPFHTLPDTPFGREGLSLGASDQKTRRVLLHRLVRAQRRPDETHHRRQRALGPAARAPSGVPARLF